MVGGCLFHWPSAGAIAQNPVVEETVVAARVETARAEGHTNWASRASLVHRYVAMTVPKVACSTIKMALQSW